MNSRHWFMRLAPGLLALAVVIATAGPSSAATYYMCVKPTTATMPDGAVIPMWGFVLDDNNNNLSDGCPGSGQIPGPRLTVPAGDSTLTINLRNDLAGPSTPELPKEISLVIPGQAMPAGSAPVYHSSGPYTGRVRSFTQEATPGGGTRSYTWNNLKPGTYLYQSGTHPQVQVQMGLYGALSKDAAAGQAYSSVSYNKQQDLFFSEIDPALHQAVTGGTYGTTGPTSTLDYHPKYFLINGEPFSAGDPCIGGLNVGENVLLRLYNAGLRELAPMMLGSHFQVVAEGGNKLPFAQTRYSVLLQPGSTKDLVFTPSLGGTFPIIERRLNLTNPTGGVPVNAPGGMQLCLQVAGAGGNNPPVAVGDLYTTAEDTPLTVPAPGVLGNDTDADGNTLTVASPGTAATSPAGSGSATLNANGSFTYTPASNFNGAASFTYQAYDGAANSNPATVTINVTAVNDPPNFTSAPVTTATVGQPYTYDVNAVDPDGTAVTYSLITSPTGMTINSTTGVISWTPAAGQTPSQNVTVRATDSGTPLPAATADQLFTITVQAAATVHVGDLDGTRNDNIGGARWRAIVTVTVHNQSHAATANATVTGTWSGGDTNGRTLSCTTAGSGQCNVTSGRLPDATANVTFTVTNVTAAGSTYQSGANHDPDGDSNGTSITVLRVP